MENVKSHEYISVNYRSKGFSFLTKTFLMLRAAADRLSNNTDDFHPIAVLELLCSRRQRCKKTLQIIVA
jgi:hypothetical protein